MMATKDRKNNTLDESLRRMGGILASPSLVTSYEHTTPLLERSWLRRMGLTKSETAELMEALCLHGLLDQGAKPLVAAVCASRRCTPAEAARLLIRGEGWPEEDEG